VLKPGGAVVLLTSNRANPFLAAATVLPRRVRVGIKRVGAGVAERDVISTRYRANTPRRLASALAHTGFVPVEVTYVATLARYAERKPLMAAVLRGLERMLPPRLRSTIVAWYERLETPTPATGPGSRTLR
jgi:hypothetical protein